MTTLLTSRYLTVARSARPGERLAFNAFTGALLELDAAEATWVEQLRARADRSVPADLPSAVRERLRHAGVLVPAGFDERAELFRIRRDALAASDTLLLTLAPTIQCNFRCTYCFENHRQEVMTPEVEAATCRFIADQATGVRAIATTWFGGEPLLQPDVLDRVQGFVNRLGEARGLRVTRGIVTNGWFLTPSIVARLRALGEWSTVQVTIDGLPETHNQRRVLHGGQGTWHRVIANCHTAMDGGLPVNLRINVDRRNAHALGQVLDRLLEEGLLPALDVSLGFVVNTTAACAHVKDDVLSDADRARITVRFDAERLQRGLLPGGLPAPQCGPMCSVESSRGFVIAPSGLVFKCWNQVDRGPEEAIGHVLGAAVPNAARERARWQRYDPAERAGCSNCRALPVCMGGCPWEYERLGRETHGECDAFRFHPEELVSLGHMRKRLEA